MTDADTFETFTDDAILARHAPVDAVNLVANAFAWRTIEEEMLVLSYDSADDLATVRDPDALHTLEFSSGDASVVLEVDQTGVIRGQIIPAGDEQPESAQLKTLDGDRIAEIDSFGGFEFHRVRGPVQLSVGRHQTLTFVVSPTS